MITADEARKLTEPKKKAKYQEALNNEMKILMEGISKECKNGFECIHVAAISSQAMIRLKELGYRVENIDLGWGKSSYIILWDKEEKKEDKSIIKSNKRASVIPNKSTFFKFEKDWCCKGRFRIDAHDDGTRSLTLNSHNHDLDEWWVNLTRKEMLDLAVFFRTQADDSISYSEFITK